MSTLSEIAARLRLRRDTFVGELARSDLSKMAKGAHLGQLSLKTLGLGAHVTLRVSKVYELSQPPKPLRGFRDLVVRRGSLADVASICEVDGTPERLVRKRFESGDIVYLGEVEGTVLAHTWLHQGAPFTEDEGHLARWRLGQRTVWSFNAAAAPEARATGLFVKVFQTALRDAFESEGADRVQCLISSTHAASIGMHEKLGFRRLGRVFTLRTPLLRVARWQSTEGRDEFTTTLNGKPPEIEFAT